MSPEIRRVRDDELRAYLRTVSTAFMEHPTDFDKVTEEVRGLWELERVGAAVGDDQILGTFRSWATELTVPGEATVAGAAVTGVTVLSTHRRRGLLRGMVAAEHASARARGDLEARTYAGEGRVILDIVDPEASGGRSRVALDVGLDGARCTPTDKSPELTVHTSAVAAAYLGGTRLRDAAVATGGMDEHRAGAGADAERLLRMPDEPWCSTFF